MPSVVFNESFFDRAVRSLVNYIKGNKEICNADWIYAHFLTDMGYIAVRAKEKLNIKVAAITRGDDVHAWPASNPALIDNIRYCFTHADLMLANNKRLAKDALEFADTLRPEFGIVYNGINYCDFGKSMSVSEIEDIRNKYGLPLNKKILICVARNEYLKGWKELLEAIAENKDLLDGWLLLAITSNDKGRYSIDIEQTVKDLCIASHVIVRDFMPFEEVKLLYKATNAFILPSYNEGISNAVMEAMASGLWVIATDVGGHSEIIEHCKSGYLIQPKSKDEILKSLTYLVANYDNERNKFAGEGYKAMEKLGNYDKNAQTLIAYLSAK
ncbi:glycosyltransferase family 4 protein [Flavipsychrobacter stenotrophus]|nr:glycosyltransferase family 4 protein [Flavipsychrobacter stenotrophus]